jgi:hypothetical protein
MSCLCLQASGLDHDCIELRNFRPQLLESNNQIAPNGAADAAVHDFDDLLIGLLTQDLLVHPN